MTEAVLPVQWVTTGKATKYGEPRGWKLHAIRAVDTATFDETSRLPAACGLRPRKWGLDLFIEKKCAGCLRALGLACGNCGGTGLVTGVITGCSCIQCRGTGEKK